MQVSCPSSHLSPPLPVVGAGAAASDVVVGAEEGDSVWSVVGTTDEVMVSVTNVVVSTTDGGGAIVVVVSVGVDGSGVATAVVDVEEVLG